METGKPKIAILMAVYEPRMDWLREQLLSLDAQTYPNLTLYVRDDCSPTVPFEDIQKCVRECIHAFAYTIARNKKNLGSNGTFELLTNEAEAEYFAYCDQDDIWLPEKLEILQREIEKTGALLVCSDMYVIDGEGKVKADSITKVRRHHKFLSGENLTESLLFRNFVTGCTMLIRSEVAKQAIPFCPYMVHDHYLALFASLRGSIRSLNQPLVKYRIHGGNQTDLMAGVSDRESYLRIRIEAPRKKFKWLLQYFPCQKRLRDIIQNALDWTDARYRNMKREDKKAFLIIWKHRSFSLYPSIFEIVAPYLPDKVFRFFICCARKNLL